MEDLAARQHSLRIDQTAEKLQEAYVDQDQQIPALIDRNSSGLYMGGDGESPERTQANYVP
jgi:hypothetical protein